MSRRRRYRLPPPGNAEHIVGEGYEFKPEHDRVNAGKPPLPFVEFTSRGGGTSGPVFEFKPEDDKVAEAAKAAQRKAERRAAFLAEVARCRGFSAPSNYGGFEPRLVLGEWEDVIPDPGIWPTLTNVLVRYVGDTGQKAVLNIGRAPLARYWLFSNGSGGLREVAIEWLSENWRQEWNVIDEEMKRELVEHFAGEADRSRTAAAAVQNTVRGLFGDKFGEAILYALESRPKASETPPGRSSSEGNEPSEPPKGKKNTHKPRGKPPSGH